MSYSETLARMVENSGMTLKDLADKCKQSGVRIDPSYISKLQTAKQLPASDEINIAIAKACDSEPDILLYEAYMEKAPEMIREFIKKLTKLLKINAKLSLLSQVPKEIEDLIEEQINGASEYELIQLFLTMDTEKLESIGSGLVVKDHSDKDVRLLVNDFLNLNMPDDSMAPIINKGARVQIEGREYVKSGDIVVAVMEDKSYLIRRFISLGDKVVLIAENSSYEPLTIEKTAINLAGRVKSITMEL